MSILDAIFLMLVIKKGSKKRKSNLTGAKSKKSVLRYTKKESKWKVLWIRIDPMPKCTT